MESKIYEKGIIGGPQSSRSVFISGTNTEDGKVTFDSEMTTEEFEVMQERNNAYFALKNYWAAMPQVYQYNTCLNACLDFGKKTKINPARIETRNLLYTGISRNEPCPCGSGIKFKKCCITKLKDINNE